MLLDHSVAPAITRPAPVPSCLPPKKIKLGWRFTLQRPRQLTFKESVVCRFSWKGMWRSPDLLKNILPAMDNRDPLNRVPKSGIAPWLAARGPPKYMKSRSVGSAHLQSCAFWNCWASEIPGGEAQSLPLVNPPIRSEQSTISVAQHHLDRCVKHGIATLWARVLNRFPWSDLPHAAKPKPLHPQGIIKKTKVSDA
jgi:hypothetical protein